MVAFRSSVIPGFWRPRAHHTNTNLPTWFFWNTGGAFIRTTISPMLDVLRGFIRLRTSLPYSCKAENPERAVSRPLFVFATTRTITAVSMQSACLGHGQCSHFQHLGYLPRTTYSIPRTNTKKALWWSFNHSQWTLVQWDGVISC